MSESERKAEAGGGRFRRPRFGSPLPEDEEKRLPAVPQNPVGRELGMFVEPLGHLAEAFRDNTEALRSLAEGQARIGKRLERSDRSEAVIQSTQALNDTFRGVQRTQERLMTRLEDEGRRPWRLLLAGGLALVLLIGGLLWFLLGWLGERDDAAGHTGVEALKSELAKRDGAIAMLRDDLEGREKKIGDLERDARDSAAEILRQESRREEQVRIVGELERAVAVLEEERRGLREIQASVSLLRSENSGLEEEVVRLSDETARLRRELSQSRETIAGKDSRIAELEGRIRDVLRRETGRAEALPSVEPIAGTPEEGAAEGGSRVPAGAVTDPAQRERLRVLLNRLLAGALGAEIYEFRELGGMRGKVLYEVALVQLDETGREAKKVEGGQCRVVFFEAEKRAELRFTNGHLTYSGVRVPFWGNKYVIPIDRIDPASWKGSGLTILDHVR